MSGLSAALLTRPLNFLLAGHELAALPGLDVDLHLRNPFGMTMSPFPPGEVAPVVLGGEGDYAAAESRWAVHLTRPMSCFLAGCKLAELPGLDVVLH